MVRAILDNDTWHKVKNVLIELGCHVTDNLRKFIEGMFWRIRTGSPWRDLPCEFGPWNSVYRLYNRWSKKRIFDGLLEAVEGKIDFRTGYIDGSYVNVHQHACGAANVEDAAIGPSRGGYNVETPFDSRQKW